MGEMIKLQRQFRGEKVTVVLSLEDQKKIIKKLDTQNRLWDVMESTLGKNWFHSIAIPLYKYDSGRELADRLYNALGEKRFAHLTENCEEILDEKSYSRWQLFGNRMENWTESRNTNKSAENSKKNKANSQEFLELFQEMCAGASAAIEKYENDLMEIEQINLQYRHICAIMDDYKEKILPQYELFQTVAPQLVHVAAFEKNNGNPPPFGDVENSLGEISARYKACCQNHLPIGGIKNYFDERKSVSPEAEDKIREYKKLFSAYQNEILLKIRTEGMTDEIENRTVKLFEKQSQMDEELKCLQENQEIQKKQIIYQQEYPIYYDRRAYWDYAELLGMLEPVLQKIAARDRRREEEVYEIADSIRQVIDGAKTSQGEFLLSDCRGDERFDLNFDYSTYNQPALFYREKSTERLQCLTRGKTSKIGGRLDYVGK